MLACLQAALCATKRFPRAAQPGKRFGAGKRHRHGSRGPGLSLSESPLLFRSGSPRPPAPQPLASLPHPPPRLPRQHHPPALVSPPTHLWLRRARRVTRAPGGGSARPVTQPALESPGRGRGVAGSGFRFLDLARLQQRVPARPRVRPGSRPGRPGRRRSASPLRPALGSDSGTVGAASKGWKWSSHPRGRVRLRGGVRGPARQATSFPLALTFSP